VGDQHILVRILTPTKLSDKQKQLLREFGEISGSSPLGAHEESFLSKVKRAFKGE
jgi:molecular chaperone DnaJ